MAEDSEWAKAMRDGARGDATIARSTGMDGLACQHRYRRWADFQLCRLEGGTGYGLVIPCELGDHWRASDAATPARYAVDLVPHT